jgi:hypothetical protein
MRRVSTNFDIEGYQERVDTTFGNHEIHRFLQGLRNALNHAHFVKPHWQVVIRPGEQKTQFILKKETLDRFDKWHSLARQLINKHPSGIDLEQIILDYRDSIDQFHSWLRTKIRNDAGENIDEYLSCEKALNAEASRSYWRIILNEGIKQGIDPYDVLQDYLTPDEL